jgi:hypothetical protein
MKGLRKKKKKKERSSIGYSYNIFSKQSTRYRTGSICGVVAYDGSDELVGHPHLVSHLLLPLPVPTPEIEKTFIVTDFQMTFYTIRA